MTDFIACNPGDALPSGYVRATFEESFVASLLHGLETRSGDTSYFSKNVAALIAELRADPSSPVLPVSNVEVSTGDLVAVVDLRAYKRTGVTYASVANTLNGATGLTLRSLGPVTNPAPSTRAATAAEQNKNAHDESALDKLSRYLKNAGIAVLLVVALVVAVLLWKWLNALSP